MSRLSLAHPLKSLLSAFNSLTASMRTVLSLLQQHPCIRRASSQQFREGNSYLLSDHTSESLLTSLLAPPPASPAHPAALAAFQFQNLSSATHSAALVPGTDSTR